MKDKLGIWTSIVCLIHCMVFPILATTFPIFVKIDHSLEFILIGFAFIIGCLSFYDNVIKHKYYKSLLIFILSFIIISTSIITHSHTLNYFGLIGLIVAHYLNYKKIKSLDGCHPHGCKH